MATDERFDLLAAKICEVKRQAEKDLNDHIFDAMRYGTMYQSAPRSRWKTLRERIWLYVETLWRALKGENLYDDY